MLLNQNPAWGLILAAMAMSSVAQAFTLTPMSVEFDPTGNGAARSFELDNDSDQNIAIELSLATRSMDADGKEVQSKPAELAQQFQLYPPQLLLRAHEKRSVRVSWTGTRTPERELAYRLIAEQLPVQGSSGSKKKSSSISMLLKYVAAVYITPPRAKPKVTLKEAVLTPSRPQQLKLVFENTGTAHRILTQMNILLSAGGPRIRLESKDIPILNGQNILAGATRQFLIPIPKGLEKGPIRAELEFKD